MGYQNHKLDNTTDKIVAALKDKVGCIHELRDSYLRNYVFESILPLIQSANNEYINVANTIDKLDKKYAHIKSVIQGKMYYIGEFTASTPGENYCATLSNLHEDIYELYLYRSTNANQNIIIGSWKSGNNIVQIWHNGSTASGFGCSYRYGTDGTIQYGWTGLNGLSTSNGVNGYIHRAILLLKYWIYSVYSDFSTYLTKINNNAGYPIDVDFCDNDLTQDYIYILGTFDHDSNTLVSPPLVVSNICSSQQIFSKSINQIFLYKVKFNSSIYNGCVYHYHTEPGKYFQTSIVNGYSRYRVITVDGDNQGTSSWTEENVTLYINTNGTNKFLGINYYPMASLYGKFELNLDTIITNAPAYISKMSELDAAIAELDNRIDNVEELMQYMIMTFKENFAEAAYASWTFYKYPYTESNNEELVEIKVYENGSNETVPNGPSYPYQTEDEYVFLHWDCYAQGDSSTPIVKYAGDTLTYTSYTMMSCYPVWNVNAEIEIEE